MENVQLNSFEMLSESAATDYVVDMISESEIIESILNIHDGIDEMDDSVLYTEEMVPLIQLEDSTVIVEYSNLLKLMESYIRTSGTCDEERAVYLLSEHYGIPMHNISIVIESEDAFKSTIFNLLERIKLEKDPIKKNKLRKQLNSINAKMKELKNNSKLNLMKSKSKPNK